MSLLKTTFASGDAFQAGTTSDTDKLNGITNRINAHTHDGTDTPDLSGTFAYRLMHSGTGSSSAESIADLDSHAFSAADLAANERLLIIIESYSAVNGQVGVQISGTDYMNNTSGGNSEFYEFYLSNKVENSSYYRLKGWVIETGAAVSILGFTSEGNIGANWFSGAWTLKLRGFNGSPGTLYWRWQVYRLKY